MEALTEMRTVRDRIDRAEALRATIADDEGRDKDRRQRALGRIDREIERLREFVPSTPLLNPQQAAASLTLSPEERFIVRWQRHRDLVLSAFEAALIDVITSADDKSQARLALGFPDEVRAVQRWRNESGWADRVRGLPINFTL